MSIDVDRYSLGNNGRAAGSERAAPHHGVAIADVDICTARTTPRAARVFSLEGDVELRTAGNARRARDDMDSPDCNNE
jgi:hypothetical protein